MGTRVRPAMDRRDGKAVLPSPAWKGRNFQVWFPLDTVLHYQEIGSRCLVASLPSSHEQNRSAANIQDPEDSSTNANCHVMYIFSFIIGF